MKKKIRVELKQEKRILKLMYRKGILGNNYKLSSLGWDECGLYRGKRRKRKHHSFHHSDYMYQLHYFTCDCWGEWDNRSVIECYANDLNWELGEIGESGFPISCISKKELVEHLKKMPTINNDSRINEYLKIKLQ